MTVPFLSPVCWILWGILLLCMIAVSIKALTERSKGVEGGIGAGAIVIGVVFLGFGLVGGVVHWMVTAQSQLGLTILAFLLAYPVIALVASPTIVAYTGWKHNQVKSRIGDFRQTALRPMADAIRANDPAKLRELLRGLPPPEGHDLAGHDLLTYALVNVRDENQGLEMVRVLLDAGADPRKACMPDGLHVIHYLIVSSLPGPQEGVRLLLRHGADPNVVSTLTGNTPLREASYDLSTVRTLVEYGAEIDRLQSDGLPSLTNYISTRQWASAIYLVENGAALNFRSESGHSLDGFLDEWRRGAFGPPPEGFEKLCNAVNARRRAKG